MRWLWRIFFFEWFCSCCRVFDVTMVLEQEVVNAVADKRCYSGADSNVSKKKLAMSNGNNSHRENLDREPASPGEQVRMAFLLSFQFLFYHINATQLHSKQILLKSIKNMKFRILYLHSVFWPATRFLIGGGQSEIERGRFLDFGQRVGVQSRHDALSCAGRGWGELCSFLFCRWYSCVVYISVLLKCHQMCIFRLPLAHLDAHFI